MRRSRLRRSIPSIRRLGLLMRRPQTSSLRWSKWQQTRWKLMNERGTTKSPVVSYSPCLHLTLESHAHWYEGHGGFFTLSRPFTYPSGCSSPHKNSDISAACLIAIQTAKRHVFLPGSAALDAALCRVTTAITPILTHVMCGSNWKISGRRSTRLSRRSGRLQTKEGEY